MNIKTMFPGHRVNKIIRERPSQFVEGDLVCHLDAGNINSYPGSGSNWFDLSGNGNNATLVGSPSFSTDGGGSLVFGSGKYATLPSGILNVASEAFAIEIWAKPTSTPISNNPLFYSDSSATTTFAALVLNNTSGFGINIGNTLAYHNVLPTLNQWCHVVGTRERGLGRTTQYYWIRTMFNARAPLTMQNISTSITTASPRIAGNPGNSGEYFSGNISVVRIYKRNVRSGEVWYNFNNQKNRFGVT